MSLENALLVCAGLIPAIILCVYVYIKDRADKEPISLLLLLFFAGVLICFPAAKIESALSDVMDNVFISFAYVKDEVAYLPKGIYKIYQICNNFIGVGLVEEGLKWLVLFFVTRKNKNFNSLFDGLIYAVFVSLGFAAFENVLYVLKFGWTAAGMRAITSVPGHMFMAVIMGYYYSLWHMHEKAKMQERTLKNIGMISRNAKEYSGTRYLVFSLIIPIFVHGLYDLCCNLNSKASTAVFWIVIIVLYIYCFGKIRKMSKGDTDDITYTNLMILQKYPHLIEFLKEEYAQKSEENSAGSI